MIEIGVILVAAAIVIRELERKQKWNSLHKDDHCPCCGHQAKKEEEKPPL